MAPTDNAAKLMSLSSFKLIGKMGESTIETTRKGNANSWFDESCTILTNFEQKRTTTHHYTIAQHYIAKSTCVHTFGATLEFDATELNATSKSFVVF